ncbi:hypothetical protein [Haloprofundus sp. MHR1]|uniref:hypothetical protein n=1 Tax=Haloprofundus sp. MHR1 TaxID=2572921 RepID=UPI0010BE5FAF|nr:hypothetical protein [Haloprofundus sp. MHR1]QCJ47255.1 hypothetical protein FCF25_09060 [Haloprofundus sp. MHR1]
MGKFAKSVQNYICESLTEHYPTGSWEPEFSISGTPVDIGGKKVDHLYLVELEWRRADPADNAAKIFRHLQADRVEAEQVTFFQIFTDYYKLSHGGVSSKRKNAEFVGEIAAQTFGKLSYCAVDFYMNPPKRGEKWPDTWKEATDKTVTTLCNEIELKNTC